MGYCLWKDKELFKKKLSKLIFDDLSRKHQQQNNSHGVERGCHLILENKLSDGSIVPGLSIVGKYDFYDFKPAGNLWFTASFGLLASAFQKPSSAHS